MAETVLRISTDASRNMTGLVGGSDGRIAILTNVGAFDVVLKDESASSSAANRFDIGADITIGPQEAVMLRYDGTLSRWYCIGSWLGMPTSGSIQTLLDGISTTQGVVLYYNGTDWVALGTGTAGQVLKTGGAAANPSWLGSANVISILAAADYAAIRTLLSLGTAALKNTGTSGDAVPLLNAGNTWAVATTQTFSGPIVADDTLTVDSDGLFIQDTDRSHTLGIEYGTNLAANKTLTLLCADNYTLTIAGTSSVNGTFSGTHSGTSSGVNTGDQAVTIPLSRLTNLSYILLQDQKTSGTAGGTFTSGAWRTRTLNTEVTDTNSECSLASNQFTLTAGTYEIHAHAPATYCGLHQLKVYNATDATDILLGPNFFTQSTLASGDCNIATVFGRFTIGSSKALEIQHRCSVTRATDGFGVATSWGTEVYCTVQLRRVA